MKKGSISLLLVIFCFQLLSAQITISKVAKLPVQVNENSGLLFFDKTLITHNDSGGKAELYVLDTIDGRVLRTISITNATNIDWEDIAQDKTHIYIADMGNNYSSRKNLKIYKILKEGFRNNNKITSEIIEFSYSDQSNFYPNKKSDFDAEALIVKDDKLLIFSKNRGDFKTRVYTLSKDAGTYVANYSNIFDVEGLITGATLNTNDNSIVLCGYGSGLSPFLIFLDDINSDIFVRLNLISSIGLGNQIEGITYAGNDKFYISRERLKKTIQGFSVNVPPLLFSFNSILFDSYFKETSKFITNITSKNKDKSQKEFEFDTVTILNQLKETILIQKDSFSSINTSKFLSTELDIRIKFDDEITITQKIKTP